MVVVVGDGSTQIKPNQAFEVHVCVDVGEGDGGVAVGDGSAEVMLGLLDVVVMGLDVGVASTFDVVVGSLHPNQPGVSQVVVEVVSVVLVLVAVPVVVVLSSKQPHQPGVLQVLVRVCTFEVVVVVDVVVSDPLLSGNFQLKQSVHSGLDLHSGT